MKIFLHILLCCILFSVTAYAGTTPVIPQLPSSQVLTFKENKNQWYSAVKFLGEVPGGNIFLEQQGFTYMLVNGDDIKEMHPFKGPNPMTIHGHVYKVDFVGSNPNALLTKDGESETYYNYFKGNDPSHWASNVHAYDDVTYNNLYPNIDMRVYGNNYTLEYDLTVHPDADISAVQFRYRGADQLFLRNGSLIIQTSVGKVVEVAPNAYQVINGVVKQVGCKFKLTNNILSFTLSKNYDHTQDVIIDPQLIFSTYTGSTADNWGWTATYDEEGDLYLGGYVNAIDFTTGLATGIYPTTTGAFQVTWAGGTGGQYGTGNGIAYSCDMGITKFNPTGTKLIYSTLLGGSDNECPHSLFVNSLNELCVYGETYSSDYPTTTGAYDVTYNGNADIAVTVFNTTGTALVGSTYVGGSGPDAINYDPTEGAHGNLKVNYGDNARGEIVCDNLNNIYIATSTSSTNFPTTAGCFQPALAGTQDGCVIKLNNACTKLIYSTYLGGSNDDAAYSIDLASDYSLYITGGTMSSDFPSTHNGVNPNFLGGLDDGFIVHLNSSGTAILNTTFVGTAGDDQSYCVKLDINGNVYVVGNTDGSYPVTAGVYSNPNSGQFITKFNPALDTIIYSTVFGNGNGQPNISPTAFLVDTCENVYVAGWGNAPTSVFTTYFGFPGKDMTNMPLTSDAYQTTTDGTDFYIIVLKKDAMALLYSTYFGGNGAIEHVDGGTSRFDKKGVIYEAICASCGGLAQTYPITDGGTPTYPTGVWSNTNQSQNCNELGLKMQISLFEVKAVAIAKPAATGCAPLHVQFGNQSVNATQYFWNLGDGTTTTDSVPSHIYTAPGTYNVMLVAYNPASCKGPDTAYTSIVVLNTVVTANVTANITDLCDSVVVAFTGTGGSQYTQYYWNFGDSTHSTSANPTHTFYKPGTYNVRLTIIDTSACNPFDTVYKKITVQQRVAVMVTDSSYKGCVPLTITFKSHRLDTDSTFWNFGDGTTSTDSVPTHTYTVPGTYLISLTGINNNLCNKADTSYGRVRVYPAPPIPKFTMNPTDVKFGDPVTFTNLTVGGDNYAWYFGDGTSFASFNAQHTYAKSGNYTVCLVVNYTYPCPDSVCQALRVEPPVAIGVPNAFSPNGDGQNDVLYVKGEQVTQLLFKVFNRWGEKVFETTDINVGWDGIYNGKPQDMDVYAWELFATLSDGTKVVRSGNVTLIR